MAILNSLSNFGRGQHEEHFCEIILNVDQWFRRRHLKHFLSRALADLLFGVAKPFMHRGLEVAFRNDRCFKCPYHFYRSYA